jgi:hypothetical protein
VCDANTVSLGPVLVENGGTVFVSLLMAYFLLPLIYRDYNKSDNVQGRGYYVDIMVFAAFSFLLDFIYYSGLVSNPGPNIISVLVASLCVALKTELWWVVGFNGFIVSQILSGEHKATKVLFGLISIFVFVFSFIVTFDSSTHLIESFASYNSSVLYVIVVIFPYICFGFHALMCFVGRCKNPNLTRSSSKSI